MALFKKNKTNYFFEQFLVVSQYSQKVMQKLKEGLTNFDPNSSLILKNEVHDIEHEADKIKNEIEERLAKEFMTPIDREDIFLLLDALDDLTDSIDEISYKIYVRDYQKLPPRIDLFLTQASDSVDAVVDLISHLGELTNKNVMDPILHKIREIEAVTDHLYEEEVHALYTSLAGNTAVHYRDVALSEKIYGMFEYVTDRARDVAKQVDIIMYKNL